MESFQKTERTAGIVDWLETSTEGKEAAKSIVAYFKNGVRISNSKGKHSSSK